MEFDDVAVRNEGESYYGNNPYYNPKSCGLEMVKAGECRPESYAFDIDALWRDPKSMRYYMATDSGCSCPTPFDGTTIADMTEVKTKADVVKYLRDAGGSYNARDEIYVAEFVSGWEFGVVLDGTPHKEISDGGRVEDNPSS